MGGERMKTAYSFMLVIILGFVLMMGIGLIIDNSLKNGNLDAPSLNLVAQYESSFQDINRSIRELQFNDTQDPEVTEVNDFFREFAFNKGMFDKIRTGFVIAYKFPDLFLSTVPFVAEEDLEIWRFLAWLLIGLTTILIIVKALRSGIVDEG